jgi:transposase
MGIARNTVRRYLADTPPVGRQPTERKHPVTDAVRPRLHALLAEAPRWTGGKQRLTSMKLHEMLLAGGLQVSARMVRREVAEWRRQRQEVFVPLVYQPGDLAEVDFFEVLVDVSGQRQKAWMFLLRLMYSGRDFAWLYPRQDQVCFLDGHVRAFAHLGAAPQRLAYDNLKPAVTRVLVGAERQLARRFLAFATHYVVEPSFARPRTGHDKGGVEARGKGVRWQHLVPIPSGPDLESISRELLKHLDEAAEQRRGSDGRTVVELFTEELPAMLPLPGRPFRAAAVDTASVSRRALVKVAGASYSVWCDWAGLDVTTYLGVEEVELVGRDGRRVQHPRQAAGRRSVDYRHYLPELARKPQAVRQVAGELVRDLGPPFGELWQELVDEDGPRYASRIFAKVLEAVVELGRPAVVQRLHAARADHVPVLLALRPPAPPPRDLAVSVVPTALQDIEVIASGVQHYDSLLGDAA